MVSLTITMTGLGRILAELVLLFILGESRLSTLYYIHDSDIDNSPIPTSTLYPPVRHQRHDSDIDNPKQQLVKKQRQTAKHEEHESDIYIPPVITSTLFPPVKHQRHDLHTDNLLRRTRKSRQKTVKHKTHDQDIDNQPIPTSTLLPPVEHQRYDSDIDNPSIITSTLYPPVKQQRHDPEKNYQPQVNSKPHQKIIKHQVQDSDVDDQSRLINKPRRPVKHKRRRSDFNKSSRHTTKPRETTVKHQGHDLNKDKPVKMEKESRKQFNEVKTQEQDTEINYLLKKPNEQQNQVKHQRDDTNTNNPLKEVNKQPHQVKKYDTNTNNSQIQADKLPKSVNHQGHGPEIDDPDVPAESELENILESEMIFEENTIKKPKHLHEFDKKWQKAEDDDYHNANPTEDYTENQMKQRTFGVGIELWPHKTVPYKINKTTYEDLNEFMGVLEEAIALFSKETCIKWKPWDKSLARKLGHSKYMTFQSGVGCTSTVGFLSGTITLSQPGGCLTLKMFVHEMLHAIGMHHEHVRSDRDQYIRIHWENIKNGIHAVFQEKKTFDFDTLDPYSIMEYGLKVFSKNGVRTIELKNKQYEFLTRLTRVYSFYDFKSLNTVYECHDKCKNPPECQNYGYVDKSCVCRCPAGLKGTRCHEREGNCGCYINLASGEVREIKSPGWPNSYNVNLNCVWLIHAPAKHRVKVTIKDMDLAWNKDEERCYHWLEMHTNLIGEPGLIRCGLLSDLSTAEYIHSVNREAGVLLLNFDSTFSSDKRPTKGFKLEVEAFKSGCLSRQCRMGSTCIEGNNDYTFRCSCISGYSGPLCDQVEADATVTCDMEEDFGDHCFLTQKSYGWKIDDSHKQSGITIHSNEGVMFARPTTNSSELISGVTFKEGNRCLSFDYYNHCSHFRGGITVYYETKNERNEILSTYVNEGKQWKTIHKNITTTEGFKLVFRGKMRFGRMTAIDNVIVAPGFCGTPCVLVNPCKNGGKCVPSSDYMDFRCHCSNAYIGQLCERPSKHTIFKCDFERGQPCFLTQVTKSAKSAAWIVRGGKSPTQFTGPSTAKNGDFYSYVDAASAKQNDIAVYRNEYRNLRKTRRCLTFYYHMHGKDMGTLRVKITERNGLKTILWEKEGHHPNKWFKVSIDIPAVDDLNVYIQGIVGSGLKSDIAIDDVVLRPGICGCVSKPCQNGGTCKHNKGLESYSCTCLQGYHGANCEIKAVRHSSSESEVLQFRVPDSTKDDADTTLYCDLERGEDSCFLKQDLTDNFQWTRHKGPTPTSKTGPKRAAGKGQYYYYIKGEKRNNQIAILYTTDILVPRDRCLKFYYHMHGRTMGSLEVKTNTKSLFLRRGDQLDKWHYAVVPVEAEQNLQITFVGTAGPWCQSIIAIDDISLEPRGCGCESRPCKNGATCVDTSGDVSYRCYCMAGFFGSECDIVGKVRLMCTLEDSDGDCFFIQDETESRNWIKQSGKTPTAGTGPPGAFEGGTYYYYMESTYIHYGAVAMLRTTSEFKDMKRCLELNYFMYGYGCGKLKVKANEKTVFSVSRSQENQWLTTFIEMPIPLHNISIVGVKGTTSQSDIGIDDIVLHPHPCEKIKKKKKI